MPKQLVILKVVFWVSTIVLAPVGIYAIKSLMRRDIAAYYGRYR